MESPFARKAGLKGWAMTAEHDLHTEAGRPKTAQRADEKATDEVRRAYDLTDTDKAKALAKYKPGTRVKANHAFKGVKEGDVGSVKNVIGKTAAGAIRYLVNFDGKFVETIEASLDRG